MHLPFAVTSRVRIRLPRGQSGPEVLQPARIWRRGAALAIDYLIIIAVLQVAAIVLFPLTGGSIQGGGLVQISDCRWPPTVSPQMPHRFPDPPRVMYVTGQRDCWLGPWGMSHAHFLKVKLSPAAGKEAKPTLTIRILLDKDSRVVSVFWLDVLILPLLLIYGTYFESRSGATPGKRLLGLRVLSGAKLPSRAQAVTRNLLLFLPFVPLAVLSDGLLLLSPSTPGMGTKVIIAEGLASFGAAAWAIAVAVIALGTGVGPHDRWAGTKVVGRTPAPPTSSAADA